MAPCRYTAKESVVHMQTNLLNVFENLATNMAKKRSREWLRRMFREWCYMARELKVGGLQEHFDMLQQQHTNLCQLLADARQRAEVLEVRAAAISGGQEAYLRSTVHQRPGLCYFDKIPKHLQSARFLSSNVLHSGQRTCHCYMILEFFH